MFLFRYLTQDFSVNAKRSAQITTAVLRLGQLYWDKPRWHPMRYLYKFLELLWMRGIAGADIPPQVVIGPRLRLPHAALGVVIHGNSRLGADVTLYHHVTLGARMRPDDAPTLEDQVFLGVGATVLGGIRLGNGCQVGAGAVVLRDVPAAATAIGVPARIVASADPSGAVYAPPSSRIGRESS